MEAVSEVVARWDAVFAVMAERFAAPEYAEHLEGFRAACEKAKAEELEEVA